VKLTISFAAGVVHEVTESYLSSHESSGSANISSSVIDSSRATCGFCWSKNGFCILASLQRCLQILNFALTILPIVVLKMKIFENIICEVDPSQSFQRCARTFDAMEISHALTVLHHLFT